MTRSRSAAPPTVLEGAALPHQLRDMLEPPAHAYLWGCLPPGPRVGIVGMRSPSREGFRIAFEVARQLAALGVTIVSGGALGVDRAAHLGALRARGKTLVVAPLWYDRAYPKQNRKLFRRIVAGGGAYLTTSPADARAFPLTFRRRNEVLVALCDVLLLGEMGTPSGALNAAYFAREAKRPHFLLPWSTRALDTRGTQAEYGRHVPGYFNPVQLVKLLAPRVFDNVDYWERSARAVEEHTRALKEKDEQRSGTKKQRAAQATPGASVPAPVAPESDDPVACAIARGATTIDAIVERTTLAAAVVQHRVLRLTLEGVVLRDSAGLLRVARAAVEHG